MSVKHILFVDDNDNVISGIQRQLRPYRHQWQLFFAKNGPQALQLMTQQPIDLIVSDMVMPEMHGDELLRTVAERYPSTVRMLLSGFIDDETLKAGLASAHQYLGKPCTAESLREAISQVFKIQACVRNPKIIAEIGDPNRLPSLPRIYNELNAAIADENTTINEIAEIFARDMVLSAKLLQLINSPYFGVNRVVSNLTDAINLIGIRKLNHLVLSVHVKNAFPPANPDLESNMEYLWRDAGRVSELARLISLSENQQADRPDQAYLAGLLHNMGLLIFMWRGGAKLEALLHGVSHTQQPVGELETSIYGFTRSEAAAYVLSLWNIPPRIIEAILLQHTPNETDYDGINALTAVHVAASLLKPSVMYGFDRLFDIPLDTAYLQRIGRLERLPDWQFLADKVMAYFAGK